jgi:hypothetical protein
MTNSTAQVERVVPIVHAALTAAPAFFAVAVGFVVSARPMPALPAGPIQVALVAVASVLLITATFLGQRIPPRGRDETVEAYWRTTLPRAVVLWGVLEAAGFTAGLAGLFSGHLIVPPLGVLAFLGLMFLYAPGRLAGG